VFFYISCSILFILYFLVGVQLGYYIGCHKGINRGDEGE
jgi:hypothetical protein